MARPKLKKGEKTVRVGFSINEKLWKKFEKQAQRDEVGLSELFRAVLEKAASSDGWPEKVEINGQSVREHLTPTQRVNAATFGHNVCQDIADSYNAVAGYEWDEGLFRTLAKIELGT